MQMVDPQPRDWRRRIGKGRSDRRVRSMLIALAAGVILVLLISATNSVVAASGRISADARVLSETDESIRSATVARTLMVLAAVAVADGEPPPSFVEVDTAMEILASTESSESAAFSNAIAALRTQIDSGERLDPILIASLENTFQNLFEAQVELRSDLSEALVASEKRLSDISTLAGLSLLFVVPTLSIAVYRALTKPDLEQAAMGHAAEVREHHDRRRLDALSAGLSGLRQQLQRSAPPMIARQQLDELAAMTGIGTNGEVRERVAVDLRTTLVSAVNRVETAGAVPITGTNGSINGDSDQLTTMFAAVLGAIDYLLDMTVEVTRESDRLIVVAAGIGIFDGAELLTATSPWDVDIRDASDRRLIAARSLALDLGVFITPIDADADRRCGLRVSLPRSADTTSRVSDVGGGHDSGELEPIAP